MMLRVAGVAALAFVVMGPLVVPVPLAAHPLFVNGKKYDEVRHRAERAEAAERTLKAALQREHLAMLREHDAVERERDAHAREFQNVLREHFTAVREHEAYVREHNAVEQALLQQHADRRRIAQLLRQVYALRQLASARDGAPRLAFRTVPVEEPMTLHIEPRSQAAPAEGARPVPRRHATRPGPQRTAPARIDARNPNGVGWGEP